MDKKLFAIIVFILMCSTSIFAENHSIIYVDNSEIQEYRGHLGKWVLISSKNTIGWMCRDFSVTLSQIFKINHISNLSGTIGEYLFIPFSEHYLKKLKSRGIQRTRIATSEDKFIWPIEKVAVISSVLGFRGPMFHPGVDIPATRGTAIRAAMAGRVIYSKYMKGYGNTVELEHRKNFITKYAHNSTNLVRKGQFVKKGQVIAFVGSTGNSTGNHLHFEIRCVDVPLDPLDFLPKRQAIKLLHTVKNWK